MHYVKRVIREGFCTTCMAIVASIAEIDGTGEFALKMNTYRIVCIHEISLSLSAFVPDPDHVPDP